MAVQRSWPFSPIRWRLRSDADRDAGFRRARHLFGASGVPSCMNESPVKVWFDGDCPLCRREIAVMRKLDRRGAIHFVDIAGDGPADCPIDRSELLVRFHAEENGTILSGAAAFAAMWRAIPLLRPLGLFARNRWVLAGLEWLYRRFLKVRPRLQRLLG